MRTGLSQSALLFYNNVLALPVMTSFMLATTDEIRDVAHYPQIHESSFQVREASGNPLRLTVRSGVMEHHFSRSMQEELSCWH